MLRIRKRVLAIAIASVLSSGMANALVLGELTVNSAQNQPLDAEIELLDVRDLTAEQVAPSLAPAEEFSKAGAAYPAYLQDLTFTPVIIPNGRSLLRVTSSRPVSAPLVRVLVQVMWPQGRLLRDYSLRLDRPEAQQASAGNTVAPAQSAGNYTTKRRDTLWQIAARNSNGGSIQQTMLAIQALNPDAFIGNNINLLKAGQVLRLPDQAQVQSIPQGEAVAEVAEQYAAWREGRRLGPRARQLDATRRGEAQAAPERIAQGDNLRLVAPQTQADAASGNGVSDQLAVAQESLDTTRRDNEELKSRMGDLQSQLDKLEKLIALKNDQLARLQAQGDTPASAAPADVTEPAPAVATAPPAVADPAPIAPVVEPAPAVVDTEPGADQPEQTQDATTPAQGTLDSLLGNPVLLGLIAGSLFLVLLLLILLLLRKRKAEQEAERHMRMARELEEEGPRDPDFDMPLDSDDTLLTPPVTLSPAVVAASAAAASAAASIAAHNASVAAADPVDTALVQAQQSIDAGRLNQAAQGLEPLVAAHPQRADARLKLMEVYARQGDQDAFAEQERLLADTPQNQEAVAVLKARYPAMLALATGLGAAALAAEMDEQYVQGLMQDKVQPAPAPVAEPIAAPSNEPALGSAGGDDAFDLSLDDGLASAAPEAAIEAPSGFGPALTERDAIDLDQPADDDFETLLAQAQLEALEPPAPAASAREEAAAVDDFAEFDLDVPDTSTAQPAAEVAANEPPLADDFDLSLSLDDDSPAARQFASELDDVNSELDKLSQSLATPALDTSPAGAPAEPDPVDDLDFDFFSGTDEVTTKLDLARAYVDMGDHQGARDILDEVVKDGDQAQRQEAKELLGRLV
ncbi:FimV/HubP family polar landmark protein [Pseudomonas cremoricolorata]|uniref:Peptidoglycan-binding protein n=1 Tax=Pseudomonas cremoricolorata TaxID=157783 RepID=A0A089WWC7_9PSED|nr:FimV/HubP family polar landmark protein [Pseudomonas cremoricolorata]AIR91544.1 peptidoglycan-binding protein [Pseudomonas cremoricolorata]